MVRRQDIRDMNQQIQEFQEAFDEMMEIHEQSQNPGVTVDSSAYADAQERVKSAVAEMVNHSDDMVDRTDVLEGLPDSADVQLPNAALARDGASTTKPSSGGT